MPVTSESHLGCVSRWHGQLKITPLRKCQQSKHKPRKNQNNFDKKEERNDPVQSKVSGISSHSDNPR